MGSIRRLVFLRGIPSPCVVNDVVCRGERHADASGPFEASPTGTSPAIGIGFDALLGGKGALALNINWTRYLKVGDLEISGHENDRDLFGVGVAYRFGL